MVTMKEVNFDANLVIVKNIDPFVVVHAPLLFWMITDEANAMIVSTKHWVKKSESMWNVSSVK